MDTRDTILDAAVRVVADDGLSTLTVGRVARRAQVSTALVHYHFATKERLVAEVASRVAKERAQRRVRALEAAPGLPVLDALWTALTDGPGRALSRSWSDLTLLARRDAAVKQSLADGHRTELRATVAALPALLEALGAEPGLPVEEVAPVITLLLDGLSLQIALGTPAGDFRTAFDAFWLALAAGGGPGRPA